MPAYAHNDYANPRPLHEALELGFRGVEADVLLRGGELRLGHDAGELRPGRTLETLYLAPLRQIVRECGWVLEGPLPFLLNIELKDKSIKGFDSLVALIARYAELVDPADRRDSPPVEIVLVGWHPSLWATAPERLRLFRIQQQVTGREPPEHSDSAAAIRLISLDYGKTIGWSGRGPLPVSAAGWLAVSGRRKSLGPAALPGPTTSRSIPPSIACCSRVESISSVPSGCATLRQCSWP